MATTAISAKDVQALRERTGAGMMDCKRALEQAGGDMEKAVEILRKSGAAKADKRTGRTAREGMVGSYIHFNGKVGVLVEVNCETDFVARNPEFSALVKTIAEHIAAAAPLAVDAASLPADVVDRERRIAEEQVRASGKPENIVPKIVEGKIEAYYKTVALMSQPWVRDDSKTIGELVKEASAKTGENIQVRRFARFQLGQE